MRLAITSILLLHASACGVAADTVEPPPFYIVEQYDPRRDPVRDLAATIQLARRGGKHVIVQVGGDWCGWCHLLERTMKQNADIANALRKNFLVMKVSVSHENPNQPFLSRLPVIQSFPHLFAFNAEGKLIGSQDGTPLEADRGYSERAILALLSLWAPQPEETEQPQLVPSPQP